MNSERARQVIAEAVGRGSASISDDAAIGVTEGWDSLAHMRLIELLESNLGRPLNSSEVISVRSLADVVRLFCDQTVKN